MEIGLMFIVYVAIAVAAVVLYGAVVAKDLQMLQQNSYRNERYVRWIKTSGDTMSPRRLFNVALFLLLASSLSLSIFVAGIALVAMIVECAVLMTRKSKKPLVFTKRVWRLFATINVLAWVMAALVAFVSHGSGFRVDVFGQIMMLATAVSSAITLVANWL